MAHPDQRWGDKSYAQHGDDFMLLNLCELLDIRPSQSRPTYLDLGAHHPEDISNTKLLYDRGHWGLNVEANPELFCIFEKERPLDTNYQLGIVSHQPMHGHQDFYMYGQRSGRNTLSKDEAERVEREHNLRIREKNLVPVMDINSFMQKTRGMHYPPILLSDIEGLDYPVLQAADFSVGPPIVICVETRMNETIRMRSMLNEKGFTLYARMGENLFFVRNDYISRAF